MRKLLLIFLLWCNDAHSQDTTNKLYFKQSIDSIFKSFANTPGLGIGIVSNGQLIINKTFGLANLDYRIQISDSSIFPLASISKEFTAYCILLLEKQVKLSLQDEIHKYLPQLPMYSKPIFISDLLHQTSGLRDFIELLAVGGWRVEDIISLNDALSVVYKQKGLNFLPHTKFHYSNTNYLLLGEIIKKITGRSLAEFAKTNIFDALKMNKTTFNESFRKVVPNLASSYYSSGNNNFRKALLNYAYTGSTGVYSTVLDVCKWIMHIINLYQQNDPLYQKMIMLEKLPAGEVNNYASGFFISSKNNKNPMMYHDGYDAAYRTYMACFPSLGSGFVLLSNTDAVNPKYYGTLINDILLKNNIPSETTTTERRIKDDLKATSTELNNLEGTYEMEDGFVFEIKRNKEVLNVILDGEGFRLYPQLNGEWSVKEFDYNITFNNAQGTILLRQNGEIKKGHKVQISKLAEENSATYIGKYYSDEVSQSYEIKIIPGKLIVSHLKHGEIEMTPFTKDVFRSGISFFERIRFERSTKGEVIGFTYLGRRAMGMFFKKIKAL